MQVAFNKDACTVSDTEKPIMKGARSSDNCYLWNPHKDLSFMKQENLETWHRRLGHTNYTNIQQLISKNAVRGLPKLEVKEKLCGDFQVGKQTRVSHQQSSQVTTSRVLELLHMDLMGPVQVECIYGKKYIFVCMDDYSRYTWVKFLRKKLDAFAAFKQLATRFRKRRKHTSSKLEVTMVKNLRMLNLMNTELKKASNMSSPHQLLLSKMVS
ncbi:hypothetical protein LIER_18164 [Lithospermum erythrorhizon]|uniref:GAG-pre-integrase domain-containing protein n=1 Tax=Lithospermum erythrorhizon TaxID=34254 RepID=A0AAV3QD67_LITER